MNALAQYFMHLACVPRDLYLQLRTNPNIVTRVDGQNQTLLHHLATVHFQPIFSFNQDDDIPVDRTLAWKLIFHMPKVNLIAQDKDGNTPLHINIADCRYHAVLNAFPDRLKCTADAGFDFSVVNKNRWTVLHAAAKIAFPKDFGKIDKHPVLIIAEAIPTIDLDRLSKDGNTTFTYLVREKRYADAVELIKLGANPLLGEGENLITDHIRDYRTTLSSIYSNIPGLNPAINLFKNQDALKLLEDLKKHIECYKKLHDFAHSHSTPSFGMRP